MKKLFLLSLTVVLLASMFISGCKENTASTIILYEFTGNYDQGTIITPAMFKEIQVDISKAFMTSDGKTYTADKLGLITVITEATLSKYISTEHFLQCDVATGQLAFSEIIDTMPPYLECVRLKTDVECGAQITAAHLEVVSVPSYAIPAGAYKNASEVVGKYATSQLYAGDYLTPGKLSTTSISNIPEGKIAMSISISSFSGSLSGKLENGDIVSFWFKNEDGEPYVPEELQYVMIIAVNTGDGIDKDQIIVNEDGSFSIPTTITIAVSEIQAKVLGKHKDTPLYLTLVYRGNEERANEYLEKQDAVLKELYP